MPCPLPLHRPSRRPRARAPGRDTTGLLAGALAIGLLSACSDAGRVTAPEELTAPTGSPAASATVSCDLAMRTTEGKYLVRTSSVSYPETLGDPAGPMARFGYRGWKSGLTAPVRLVTCMIPDNDAARAYFSNLFRAKVIDRPALSQLTRLLNMTEREAWRTRPIPVRGRRDPGMYTVDALDGGAPIAGVGGAMRLLGSECDPALVDLVPPECEGWTPAPPSGGTGGPPPEPPAPPTED
jgi:hypothetical protein